MQLTLTPARVPFGESGYGLWATKNMLCVEDNGGNRALVVAHNKDYGVCYINHAGVLHVRISKDVQLLGDEVHPTVRSLVIYKPLAIDHITKIPLHLFVYAGGFG
jgi:hypothetical protein